MISMKKVVGSLLHQETTTKVTKNKVDILKHGGSKSEIRQTIITETTPWVALECGHSRPQHAGAKSIMGAKKLARHYCEALPERKDGEPAWFQGWREKGAENLVFTAVNFTQKTQINP